MKFWKKNKSGAEGTQLNEAAALDNLRAGCDYFKRNLETHVLFKVEYAVVVKVVSILEQKDSLAVSDVSYILNMLNEFDDTEHYNGSGWFDFQIRLSYYLRLKGFNADIVGGKMHLI